MRIATLGNSVAHALANAPPLEFHDGEWQIPESALETPPIEAAALADLDMLELNVDGYDEALNAVHTATAEDLYAATAAMLRSSKVFVRQPRRHAMLVGDVAHERDHFHYLVGVLGLEAVRQAVCGVRVFRSPAGTAAANRPDVIATEDQVLYKMHVTPMARIAKVDWGLTLAYPLEPSDGDYAALQKLGYPTLRALVEAARRTGRTVLPKSWG